MPFGKKLPVEPVSVFGLLTSGGALEISVATVNFGATSSGLACKVGVSVGITDFFGFTTEALRKGLAYAGKSVDLLQKKALLGLSSVRKTLQCAGALLFKSKRDFCSESVPKNDQKNWSVPKTFQKSAGK